MIGISVVVPTRNRPELLGVAIASVLRQTYRDFEIVAIVDGPDRETVEFLASLRDPRMRFVELAESHGANHARNLGASMANGKYIAYLDDDDEWMPHKLERQWELLEADPLTLTIASCRFLARGPEGDAVWPRRLPAPGESVSDYLFSRNSFTNGETALNTSTLVVPKHLLDRFGFDVGVTRHQEADWLLRVSYERSVHVLFVSEPAAIVNRDENRTRITNTHQWRQSLDWIRRHRPKLRPAAYSAFILTQLAGIASRQRAWNSFGPLFWEALRLGKPTTRQIFIYFCMWLFPPSLRPRLAALCRPKKAGTSVEPANL